MWPPLFLAIENIKLPSSVSSLKILSWRPESQTPQSNTGNAQLDLGFCPGWHSQPLTGQEQWLVCNCVPSCLIFINQNHTTDSYNYRKQQLCRALHSTWEWCEFCASVFSPSSFFSLGSQCGICQTVYVLFLQCLRFSSDLSTKEECVFLRRQKSRPLKYFIEEPVYRILVFSYFWYLWKGFSSSLLYI